MSGSSGSCCSEVPPAPKRDPKVALEEARQLGRSCGGGGGCADAKPACPELKEEPRCGNTPSPPPKPACPAVKVEPPPPPPTPACPAVKEEPRCSTPPPPPEPPKPTCAKKDPPPPPVKAACPKKEPEIPPPAKAACPKKEPESPPPTKVCAAKQEPPPKMMEWELCEPGKCTPPKYANTDVGPDGKEQKCKEGTSTPGKCHQMSQQRERGDEYANPASTGGMRQFFKNGFFRAPSFFDNE